MRPYTSNSPQYLDYIAANRTRDEIKADPKLCVLLENEYIKDNMELALRWKEAKYGDYQAKYDFAEYLMCNGPEIDADTILHYREMALLDPIIVEISYSYLSNTEVLQKLRKQKYGKEVDECFKNPCFYMGRFSAAMGSEGDIKAGVSPMTYLAECCQNLYDYFFEDDEAANNKKLGRTQSTAAEQAVETAAETAARSTPVNGSGQTPVANQNLNPDGTPKSDPPTNIPRMGSAATQAYVPFSEQIGWGKIWAAIWQNDNKMFKNFTEQNCWEALYRGCGVDWEGSAIQKMLQTTSHANVRRHLGDCSRLWEHVRSLRVFDKDNAFGPMTPDMKLNGINANSMYTACYGKSDPSAQDVCKRLFTTNSIADDIINARKASVGQSSQPVSTSSK